jgi:phosphate transport system permease protein
MSSRYIFRKMVNLCFLSMIFCSSLLVFYILIWILCSLFRLGYSGFGWSLLFQSTPAPLQPGGLMNAIIGSLLLSTLAIVFGSVIGILVGFYLGELQPSGSLAKWIRWLLGVLLGTPSILFGLFVYESLVLSQHHFSGWAGCLALSMLVIPMVARATENMIHLVPQMMREAVLALGASPLLFIQFMITHVIRGGILTGILLAFSRVIGETAPLLFTCLSNQFMSVDLNEPMANLPVVIYNYAMSPFANWQQLAWSGALLITCLVLSINIITRIICLPNHIKH